MQLKLPSDTNARVAGTSSEQQTVPKSAKANAPKIENTMLTAENEELKAQLEGVKQELRTAKIKVDMEEKAREQEAEKLQKANESLEAAQKKIASVRKANDDWVLAFHTTEHQLHKATEEAISAQRVRDTLEQKLEGVRFVQAAIKRELGAKERELCKTRAEMSLQDETAKQRLLAMENMLHNSRKTSTAVASELEDTKQMLQDANDEIGARASAQAALQTELEDTKHKLHLAVKEKASSEMERTLLNSSLAMTKLDLSRVNASLAACMAENNVLKGFLSGQSATIETAVTRIVDKIAALDHSIEGRLSAFENSVNSTMGELRNGVQSNVELAEGLMLQLSEAKLPTGVLEATTAEESKQCAESSSEETDDQETSMPASLKLRFQEAVEESKRLTQAGSVGEDPDAAHPKTRHEVSELFGDYLTHVVGRMVKEEKAVHEAMKVAKRGLINHQDWLHRFREIVARDTSIFAKSTHGWLSLECWERSKDLSDILCDVEKQYDDVIDHFDTVLEKCDEIVKDREGVLDP